MFWLFWQIVGLILGCLLAAGVLAALFAIVGGFCLIVCAGLNAIAELAYMATPAKAAASRPQPYKRAGLYWDKRTRTIHVGMPANLDHSSTRERLLRAPTMAYKFLVPR